jgi:integrative and conjugative element protein (TIGR02256 family)
MSRLPVMDIIYTGPQGQRVALTRGALLTLQRHQQVAPTSLEAGGMLLGRLRGAADVLVETATEPDGQDVRSKTTFTRSRGPAQAIVNRVWEASSGLVNYLGEWHTHPEDRPEPSSIDLQNWRDIAQEATYEQSFLLFCIVGRTASPVKSVQFWWWDSKADSNPVGLNTVSLGNVH